MNNLIDWVGFLVVAGVLGWCLVAWWRGVLWERGRRALNYFFLDEWRRGRVALSDLDDEVLLAVVECEGWDRERCPPDEYRRACWRELERRRLLVLVRSREAARARREIL